MLSHESNRRWSFLAGLALLLTMGWIPATAEVAVAVQLNGQSESLSLYALGSIVDDPDPIGIWVRNNPDSGTRAILNDQGAANGDGKPSLLFNTLSGLPIVAWSRNSPSGFDVVVSSFADGSWSEPVVLADSPADELDPHLVMDPDDGTVHLLYWVNDGDPRIMRRQAPADLSSWTPPDRVSGMTEIAARPAGTFYQGSLRVAYESHSVVIAGTPRQIVLATEDTPGFSSQSISSTHHAEPNWPRPHSALGRLWIEWVDASGEMAWTRQQGMGGWEPISVEFFESTEDRDYHARGRIRGQAIQ